jgi:hypothetical protein
VAVSGTLLIVLALVIIVVLILACASFFMLWFRNQTNVNMLVAWYFLCFTVGIVVDCIRVLVIFGLGEHYPDVDMFGYIFKVASTFVAFTLVCGVHLVLSGYVGYEQPHRKRIVYYLIGIAGFFSVAGLYWFFPTTPAPSGFYMFQFEPILYVATFIAYLPVAALIFFRNTYILQRVTNRGVRIKLMLFTLLSIFLIAERGFSLGGYHLVDWILGIPTEISLLVDLIVLTVISGMFLWILIYFPGLMESIGTYFSIKKLFILKDNGLLIFECDFDENRFQDGIESDDTLIGGFVYAISQGFKEVLKSEEEINAFRSGNRSVLIERGKYVFAVLIVTADSSLLHRKLREFISRYELENKGYLENWTGDFSDIRPELIKKEIFETLRED